jgi:hypothetical protein
MWILEKCFLRGRSNQCKALKQNQVGHVQGKEKQKAGIAGDGNCSLTVR